MKTAQAVKTKSIDSKRAQIAPVLIVDDDHLILNALEMTLKREDFPLLKAKNGSEAIEFLQNEEISTIICDLHMPDINGLDVLKKALELQPDAVRIVLTGVNDLKTLSDLINIAQVSQFILKPWDHNQLIRSVEDATKRYNLLHENIELQEALEKSHKNLTKELQLGGLIHQSLLLGEAPSGLEGIEIKVTTLPSKAVDGDFFAFYQPAPHTIDVVLADVMGKGLPAAMVGTAVKSHLTRFAIPYCRSITYTKESGWEKLMLPLKEIMHHVSDEMSQTLIDLDYFVSMSYGRFNMVTKSFAFVDCGSTKPIHFHWKNKTSSLLKGDNFPLGVVQNDEYHSKSVDFEIGDLFIFYSDGVTEARKENGELFGIERLLDLVHKNAELAPEKLVEKIKFELKEFSQKNYFDDDVTIIIVKITEDQAKIKPVDKRSSQFRSDLSQLPAVRDFVHRLCIEAPGDSERLSMQMQLTLDELFTNIVEHGHEDTHGVIQLSGYLGSEQIFFEVDDQGFPFDPKEIQEPSFVGDKYGGFGLYIVKEISDEVCYIPQNQQDGWNHTRITKKFFPEEDTMNFTHNVADNVLTITLEGENLDAKEAPNFKQQVIDLIGNTEANRVLLDLHHLNFIDSSGLGCFLSLLRALNSRGGELKIAGMTKPIRTVFELVCMHKVFEIYNSKDEAMRSFQ